jgi:hypothetical protein
MQWKIAFDKMRVELILAMRLYQSQKAKLDYAEKQKHLYMARSRQLKTDLDKAWRQLTDPQGGICFFLFISIAHGDS